VHNLGCESQRPGCTLVASNLGARNLVLTWVTQVTDPGYQPFLPVVQDWYIPSAECRSAENLRGHLL
jgi:hypothetical protein